MAEDKHTPGPWVYEVNHSGSAIAKDGCCIATTHGRAAITGAPLPHEANARLIAAAPDMLNALKMVAASSASLRGEEWTAVLDAIDKADGRTA
jgi:hypothetical protein